ncbi:MAG TPA: hypothetical protein VM120_25180 [Bryobacteraceae bacterium]|nr:hypothetical protein [Bryobacteraceae bacterium]
MTPQQRATTIVRLIRESPSSAEQLIEMHIAEAVERYQKQTAGIVAGELREISRWVRSGAYDVDDARDEIARGIENRAEQYQSRFAEPKA